MYGLADAWSGVYDSQTQQNRSAFTNTGRGRGGGRQWRIVDNQASFLPVSPETFITCNL